MTQEQLDKRINELEHIVNTTHDFATGKAADAELTRLYALDAGLSMEDMAMDVNEWMGIE